MHEARCASTGALRGRVSVEPDNPWHCGAYDDACTQHMPLYNFGFGLVGMMLGKRHDDTDSTPNGVHSRHGRMGVVNPRHTHMLMFPKLQALRHPNRPSGPIWSVGFSNPRRAVKGERDLPLRMTTGPRVWTPIFRSAPPPLTTSPVANISCGRKALCARGTPKGSDEAVF